jgi:hypothetical protein
MEADLGRAGWAFLAILLAAGCDRSYGRLPPGGIAGLDGVYRGDASLMLGRTNCPREIPYAMTVREGWVYGEIFSLRDQKTVTGRFESLIDAEGKIGTKARVGSDETLIEGYFDLDRFLGSTKSENCTNRLSLRRVQS